MFGISDAMAATAAPGVGEGLAGMLPMFLVVFVLFYFMLIRPQNKKAREHRSLLDNIKVGDEVLTGSGLLAQVASLKGDFVALIVDGETQLTLKKTAISQVMPKGTIKASR